MNTVSEALAHTEWEQKTEGHSAVGVMVDVETLAKMMEIVEYLDKRIRHRGMSNIADDSIMGRTILRIAKEMRKARRDWKAFVASSRKKAQT